MTADLDTLLTALYVLADDLLPRRPRARRRPKITEAELVCLAVAQILLDCPSERRFLRFAICRLSHLFPYLPKQPGYNKRMRALAPQIVRLLNAIAFGSPSWCDGLRLLDSTPVPCGASRETVKRSQFAGHAAYGYCASHSRYFWGFRLYLLCASDGMPIAFELAPANASERDVAAEMLARVQLEGYTVIADKGFAGEEFEALMAELGAIFLRPDRKDEKARFGGLGGVRQWVESIIDTIKGQLSLERHGAHTMPGLISRIAQRLLALAAGLWHNWNIGNPGRHLTAYDH
ncbi:MAG: IS982 family transposase [Actinobacteria bacterium]|nr:IS982 family transposase [Actinomycetota bacterium]